MDAETFQRLEVELEALTLVQRETVLARMHDMAERDDNQRVIEERLGKQIPCPHCHGDKVVRFGRTNDQQRYRCNGCRRTFIALTGTPFLYLHAKSKLLTYAGCMAEGLTIRKSAERADLTVDRAFRWRHTFLAYLQRQKPSGLTGVVEADETFFRRSFKGQRKALPRTAKKRGGATKDAKEDENIPVLVALQRGTRTEHDVVLDGISKKEITEALRQALSTDVVLSTDGNASYRYAAKKLGIRAGYFVAGKNGHGGTGMWHVQNVNAYDARLKNWMHRFLGVATKYLDNYLGWRRLLDRCKDMVTPQQFLFHALRTEYQHVI
ncbi:MAG: IS1595 family transposase [Burkholderiaceae bacterium]